MHTRFCRKALLLSALVLALVLCLGGAAWADEPYPDAVPLTLNAEAYASIQNSGGYAYFRFTPSVTQKYMFTSNSDTDTYGYMYDAAGIELAYDDDSGSDRNFSISMTLEAGTTYYFGARFYNTSTTGSFPVVLTPDTRLSAEAATGYLRVNPHEQLTMTAAVSGGTPPYAFQWYTEEYDNETGFSERTPITGATALSYTWRADGKPPVFLFEVTDAADAIASVNFSPYVNNDFKARFDNDYYYEATYDVPYGETIELRMIASCDVGSISYRWYNKENKETILSTADTFTTPPVTGFVSYVCEVSDEFGNTVSEYAYVHVKNGLTVAAENTDRIPAELGGSAELSVSASCLQGSIHYKWFDSQWNELKTDTGARSVCTVTDVQTTGDYRCVVTDDYGNEITAWFTVYVDNGFTARAEGTVGEDETKIITVQPGGTAELKVVASCSNGSLYYYWCGPRATDNDTASTFTLTNIDMAEEYSCNVWDDYGNETTVRFEIYVDNGFTACAEGVASAEELKIVPTPFNGTAELKVVASCNNGSLHYVWYGPDMTENDSGSTLTVSNVAEVRRYTCYVSDDYGNTAAIEFEVQVDNAFSAEAVGKTIFCAEHGDTLTLSVDASCREGELNYIWYRIGVKNNYMNFVKVEGAAGPSISAQMKARFQGYICTVTDKYGNNRIIYFAVLDPDIVLPEGLQRVESEAFAGMRELIVWVPSSVTEIAPDAFDSSTYVIGESGTYGNEYGSNRGVDITPFLEEAE